MRSSEESAEAGRPIPPFITIAHLLAITWTVLNAHHPALVVIGLLFFLAFVVATERHQHTINLRSPMLVGFFLAALVIHGGCQRWWIAPVLGDLGRWPLMIGSVILTAFNDNAAITYLATLVPGFTEELKFAVVAGAIAGGGLTVIANAPNPAGQSILQSQFEDGGISPLKLFLGALVPTIIVLLVAIWREWVLTTEAEILDEAMRENSEGEITITPAPVVSVGSSRLEFCGVA